jgi:4-amino-4-deoxy-L-arabinose transferase-like glycosyltransferase
MWSNGRPMRRVASRSASGTHFSRAYAATAATVFFVPAVFAAAVLPYRAWDSLAFGYWSRIIGITGDLLADAPSSTASARPLFYVEQGLAWHWFGFHEWIGRLLSLAFGMAYGLAVWFVARRLAAKEEVAELTAALAVALALASSVFATFVAAGMTDVPVAATATVTAALLWSRLREPLRLPLVALAAAGTVLTKPTGLVALLGLGLAALVLMRPFRRGRLAYGLLAAAAGGLAGFSYDVVQAHRSQSSIASFLKSGNTEFYLSKGAAARADQLLRASWTGDAPRLLVLFGLLYAIARAAGLRQKLALALAAPGAVLWSIAGPIAADGAAPYPFANGFGVGLICWLALAATLLALPFLPAAAEPFDRRTQTALLCWLVPGFLSWLVYRSDDTRFLSPAWAPIAILAGGGAATAALTVRRRIRAAGFVPAVALLLLVAVNVLSIDGLRGSGWHDLWHLGPAGWSSSARVENLAYGPFSYELDLARENVGPEQTIVTSDQRLAFFFPRRVDTRYAQSCSQLVDARLFVLLTGDESTAIMEQGNGSTANPLAWLQCTSPQLHLIGEQPGIYAVYTNGPPVRAAEPSECHLSASTGQLLDGVLGDDLTYSRARDVHARAVSVGFTGAKIEQTGCDTFRVVVTGVPLPKANQADFVDEATRTGFDVKVVPPARWPEVPPDVQPARERGS